MSSDHTSILAMSFEGEPGLPLQRRKRFPWIQLLGLLLGSLFCSFLTSLSVEFSGVTKQVPPYVKDSEPRVSAYRVTARSNDTFCSFTKQYVLGSGGKRMTLCVHPNRIRVDLRQFIRNRATTRGIVLNGEEYHSLKEQWRRVDNDVKRAVNATDID